MKRQLRVTYTDTHVTQLVIKSRGPTAFEMAFAGYENVGQTHEAPSR